MAVWDIFSKRQKRREQAGQEDVFQYEDLPQPFRNQVIHIWVDALGRWDDPQYLGPPSSHGPNRWWNSIFGVMTRELGTFHLAEPSFNPFEQCQIFVHKAETNHALDIIEVTFRYMDSVIRNLHTGERSQYRLIHPDKAICELNARFLEHGIGYAFEGGEIIRIDSKYIHAEAVKPALQLLFGAGKPFQGPLDEFVRAHARHRKGEEKEAIAEALKAFESTMKAICSIRSWPFDSNKDTVSRLIDIVFTNGLIPGYVQGQFTALRSVLESGLPTVRNRTSGHGQGATPTNVPGYIAAYALHLAASNIVLLIEAHNAMP
jgi:hypothetical protein